MRGPRGTNSLYKDLYEERMYSDTVDEVDQGKKWAFEQVERDRPRKELALDEFAKASIPSHPRSRALARFLAPLSRPLSLFQVFDPAPIKVNTYNPEDKTAVMLSPVLDGHEQARERRARLSKALEEAVPEQESPKAFIIPPAFA